MARVYDFEEYRRRKGKRSPGEVRAAIEGLLWKIYECHDCGHFEGYVEDEAAAEICPKCGSRNFVFLGWGE